MPSLRCIYVFLFSVNIFQVVSNWKSLNYEIGHEKKTSTHEISTRKIFHLGNTHENRTTKYPRKKLSYPGNVHEKKFRTYEKATRKKIWIHEIRTRKSFGLTESQWHDGTRPTRTTMVRDPQNLAHSKLRISAASQRLWNLLF